MRTPLRRLSLAVIAAVLVAGGLIDRTVDDASDGQPVGQLAPVPMAAPESARSSAWYCSGATANPGGVADGTVVVANTGVRALTAAVTVFPSQGDIRARSVQVPPATRATVRLAEVAAAPHASAVVELDGGGAVVELATTGPLGDSVAACASSASNRWFFAEGVTTRDATELLTLFNPFPEDAVVDFAFSSEEGQSTPQALTGLAVRGRSMSVVNVGDFVQRREGVASRISARTGRLVVHRLQTYDGSAGRSGASVTLGSADVGDVWYFPEGLVGDGRGERFQVFNPSPDEAEVELTLSLDTGEAEPLRITVPRESRVTVDAANEGRIPKGVGHAVTVRATNGVGVVVERTIQGGAPSPRTGISHTPGGRLTGLRWASAAGQADDAVDEWVVVHNPGPAVASFSVGVLVDGTQAAPAGLQDLQVEPGRRRAVRLVDSIRRPATPVVVTATQPVVVERDLYRARGPGISMGMAVPLRS
ncbi:MAG: DUF5719 family protein [Actinomycetota bacterium]|nr:DUF5719 family protein [Actinomycetota bacterium]